MPDHEDTDLSHTHSVTDGTATRLREVVRDETVRPVGQIELREERLVVERINDDFSRMTMTFGFMEEPNVPMTLARSKKLGWKFDIMSTSFFLSRRSLKASPKGGMPFWTDRVFIALARNASDATEYFHIPTGRVVEIGTQVMI